MYFVKKKKKLYIFINLLVSNWMELDLHKADIQPIWLNSPLYNNDDNQDFSEQGGIGYILYGRIMSYLFSF